MIKADSSRIDGRSPLGPGYTIVKIDLSERVSLRPPRSPPPRESRTPRAACAPREGCENVFTLPRAAFCVLEVIDCINDFRFRSKRAWSCLHRPMSEAQSFSPERHGRLPRPSGLLAGG